MRAILLGLGWLGLYYGLANYGVHALPPSVAARTTLPEYLAMVQIVSTLLGVGGVLIATRHDAFVRATFFPEMVTTQASDSGAWGSRSGVASALLLGPPAFLAAYSLGMYLAFDTLIAELAARGARAVQAQTGELGRSAHADTLWTILPFTVVVAPLGEELLFRGGIYGAVQAWLGNEDAPKSEAAPQSVLPAGLPNRSDGVISGIQSWGKRGGWAIVASSLVFAIMHADTPGGMGIVRVTSAAVLGVACGTARYVSKGLLVPIALHTSYNFCSLASLRGWLVLDGWPTKYTIPTLLVPLSCLTLSAVGVMLVVSRRSATKR